MLAQFKNFDTDRMDIDELIELVTFGEALRKTYDQLNVEEPEFIGNQLKALKREIKAKTADKNSARLKSVKAQLETLKTPTERKAALERERKQLEAEQLQEA